MRSPTAEMLLEKLLDELAGMGWRNQLEVLSGGVKYRNKSLHPITEELLRKKGISEKRIAKFRPRHVLDHPELLGRAGLVVAMTSDHKRTLETLDPALAEKTVKFSELSPEKQEVPDPFFQDDVREAMEHAWDILEVGLRSLAQELVRLEVIK